LGYFKNRIPTIHSPQPTYSYDFNGLLESCTCNRGQSGTLTVSSNLLSNL